MAFFLEPSHFFGIRGFKKTKEIETMCESTAYLMKDGREEMLMEGVDVLENLGDEIKMIDIFGDQKKLRARIKSLSLVDHKIILEPVI